MTSMVSLASYTAFARYTKTNKQFAIGFTGFNLVLWGLTPVYRKFSHINFMVENSKGLPYFIDSKKVVNLNKTYFHIDDENNYQPSMFYDGR